MVSCKPKAARERRNSGSASLFPSTAAKKTENQEKTQVMAGSPQSTLSGIGSWSGRSGGSREGSPNRSTRVPSPTTTPFSAVKNAWDVLYAAAGEVARLKMNGEASKFNFQNSKGLLCGLPSSIAAENRAAALFANQNRAASEFDFSLIRLGFSISKLLPWRTLSVMPAAVLRNLADKLYEVEGIVKQLAAVGDHDKITSVIELLTTEFTYSPQANHCKEYGEEDELNYNDDDIKIEQNWSFH